MRLRSKQAENMNQPKYWRISDRALRNGQPSSTDRGPITFWIADSLAGDGTHRGVLEESGVTAGKR